MEPPIFSQSSKENWIEPSHFQPTPQPTVLVPKRHSMFWHPLIFIFIFLCIGTYVAYMRGYIFVKTPTSYEECLHTRGSRLQKSYPATCVTRSGLHFRQPMTLPTPVVDTESSTAPTASWKTYINTTYKYLIKHSESYEPQVSAPGIGVVTADDKANSLTIGPVSISSFEYPPRAYIFQDWTKSEVTVNGFTGTKYVKEKESNSSIDTSILRLPVGSITYIFKHPNEEIYVQIITKNNQILSTFRFID